MNKPPTTKAPQKPMPCLGHFGASRLPAVRWATKIELYRSLMDGRAYLEEHYGERISLRSVARAACMSLYHFNRLFRILFRETPHAYVTEVRLREAKRLMDSGQMALGEVAMAVGFQEASSFSRFFRKRYGISPREYRLGLALGGRKANFATSDKKAEVMGP